MKHIRLISFLMAMVLVFSAVSCASTKAVEPAVFVPNDNDIVVLFLNDVHCGIEGSIGYADQACVYKQA